MRFLHFCYIAAFMLCGTTTFANTVLGGNITWTCLGGNQYQIRLTTYQDCYGYDLQGGIPSVESVFIIPSACGSSAFQVNLNYISHTQISDLCPSELPSSSCSGGANQGVMQFVYQGTVTLPVGCIWNIVWSGLYWGYFDNANEFSSPVYINSQINTNYPCYSSPTIASTASAPQVPYLCTGVLENHQVVLANLPAGYTYSYTILENLVVGTNIFGAPAASNGWTMPLGLGSPTPTSGSSGTQISWTPPVSALTTNGIRLQIEIRDGSNNVVGVINENMVFYVRDCTATDTHFTTPPVTSTGPETTLTGSNNISVCAGDSLIFTVSAINSNPLRAITINQTPIAGLPLVGTQQGNNQANKTFKLLTTSAHVGSYTLSLQATDDACPNPDTDNISINITVHPNVKVAFSDTTICAGDNVTLIAQGLNTNAYVWNVNYGDTNFSQTVPNDAQTVSPDQTTVYRVVGTGIPASCQTQDTVIVRVLMTDLTYTKTDETCGNSNGSIDLTVTGEPTSSLNYVWSPVSGGIVQGQQDQTGLDGGATYSVTVNETVYGCQLSGSFAIADVPAPLLSFTGTTTICEGDCATLTLDLTQGSAPFTITGTNLPSSPLNCPTDPYSISVCPSTNTTYTVTGIADASGCSATINQSVTVTVRPRITASFAAAGPICLGEDLQLNLTYSPTGGGPYSVNYTITSPTPTDTPLTLTNFSGGNVNVPDPTMAGTYVYDIDSVSYTTAPTCASTDATNPSINVIVNPLPTATLAGGGIGVCAGTCRNLTLTLTGTGPWTVGYTLNNVAQTPLVVPANQSTYTWNVCPTLTSNYCITSVQDANCTNSAIVNQCANITVTPYPTLTTYTLSATDICEGDDATLNVVYGPSGQTACLYFTATPSDLPAFTPPFCSQPSGAPFSSIISPDATTVYCLDSIYFTRPLGGHCATPVSICRTLNVNSDIAVVPIDTVCNNIGTQYQITYTLSNGDTPYSEATAGTISGSTFTTNWVNNGPSPTWSFTDIHACNTVTTSVNYTCPVLTNAGTIVNNPITICGNGQATATHNNNQYLDGNDELMFILYTNGSNPLAPGSVVQQNCNAPQFSFTGLPMDYGTTYYIAAVAGDTGTPGCVNLSAANVQISNATTVVWYETPTATLSAPGSTSACAGGCVTLNIARTGQGPWNVAYTVDGSPGALSPITIPANAPANYSFCSNEDGLHELTSVSSGTAPNVCSGTVSGTVNVTINPLPTAVFDGNDSACSGQTHCFEITLTGTAPWSVIIDNPGSTNDTVNNIAASPYTAYCAGVAGSYQIISVADANNCTNTTTSPAVSLTIDPLPTVSWVNANTTYCQGDSLVLQYAISGGATSPFLIDYNVPDADVVDPAPASPAIGSITVNVAGAYEIVSVTDANGCVSANGATITITEIPTPVVDAGPDLDQCVGLPITIGTAAVAGQTYSWTALNGTPPVPSSAAQPSVNLATVPASNPIQYVVTAYTAQCLAKDTMLLTIHGLPSIQVTSLDDSLCFNTCTDLEVTGMNNSILTYAWTSSPSIANTEDLTSSDIEVCPSGNETFEVTAYETHGNATCEISETIDIVVGTEITVAEDFTAQVCYGTCAGEIHLTASGGFSPYQFDASEDITDWDTSGLCPGTYSYRITDAIGCEFMGSILIEERDPEVIDDITTTQPTCAYNLGNIQVNNVYSSYQISNADCTYNPSPNPNTTGTFANVPPCATPYTITATFMVSPTEFCNTTTTILIEPLSSAITFNADWTSDVFCYDTQACFDATPSGGNGTLDITWHSCADLNNCEVSTAEPLCIVMQADTTLYGVAMDANGCYSDTVMVEAFLSPEILLDVQNSADTVAICEYDCLDLVAAVSGGNGSVQISWFQTPNTQVGGGSPLNMCPVVNTTYYAIAFDGCSQEKTDTLVVVVHDTPEVLIDADNYQGCYPQTINFIDLSDAVVDNHTCVWNFGTGTTQSVCGDITFTYPTYGTFYPHYAITTEFGCVGRDTLNTPINIYGKPDIDFSWEPQPVTVINNRVQFNNMTTAATSYVWSMQGVGTSVMENPEFVLPVRDQGTFEVCLEATTVHGCKDTLCQDIFMETVLQVFVPNAFTPDPEDDNTINDVFLPIITGHNPDRYKIWIMNRWGDTVFYSEDHTKAWTGEFNGGTHYVPDGTYIWHIECYEMDSNNLQVYEGTVTIVR